MHSNKRYSAIQEQQERSIEPEEGKRRKSCAERRAHAASQLKEIEESCGRNNIRNFYRKANQLAAGFKSGTQGLQNSEGNLVTEAQGIIDVFKQHKSPT